MLSQSPTQFCLIGYKRPVGSEMPWSEIRETIMKIAVIGGTGLIGSKLVNKLREHGHEAVAAAPNTGVNTLTGEGLAEVLKDASVVVGVSNAPSWEDAAVLNFFEASTRNLLTYEVAAGVKHHVALSVVGTQQLSESGYFRAKIAQEKADQRISNLLLHRACDAVLRVPSSMVPIGQVRRSRRGCWTSSGYGACRAVSRTSTTASRRFRDRFHRGSQEIRRANTGHAR